MAVREDSVEERNTTGDRFRELLVYVCEKTSDRPLGDTKLNKVLYWSDFRAYRELGRSITGVRYQKLRYGPGAVPLLPARRDLVRDEVVTMETRQGGRYAQKTTFAQRPADTSLFTDDELALVDEVIAWIKPMTAQEASDLSHAEAGWNLVGDQEDIPYETALISTEPPSDDMLVRGRALAARFDW